MKLNYIYYVMVLYALDQKYKLSVALTCQPKMTLNRKGCTRKLYFVKQATKSGTFWERPQRQGVGGCRLIKCTNFTNFPKSSNVNFYHRASYVFRLCSDQVRPFCQQPWTAVLPPSPNVEAYPSYVKFSSRKLKDEPFIKNFVIDYDF